VEMNLVDDVNRRLESDRVALIDCAGFDRDTLGSFHPCDALVARYMLSYGHVSVSIKVVGVLSKPLRGPTSFIGRHLYPTLVFILHCIGR